MNTMKTLSSYLICHGKQNDNENARFCPKKVINCLEIVKEKYKESLFTDKKYKVRFPC